MALIDLRLQVTDSFNIEDCTQESACRLLHVIDDEEGFPPCLVFERGDSTLDRWMKKARPVFQQKSVLFEVDNHLRLFR